MEQPQSRLGWLVSLGQFFAWVLSSIGALLDMLYIRQAVMAILQALRVVQQDAYQRSGGIGLDFQFGYALSAFDNFFLLFLGCAALASVIGIEYYLRKGRPRGLLWKRFAKVLVIELAIFLAAILILTLI